MTGRPGPAVLILNPGSTSLKAVLYDRAEHEPAPHHPAPRLTAQIDRLGTPDARWTLQTSGSPPETSPFVGDLPAAVRMLADRLHHDGVGVAAVAHRVVHGGSAFTHPVLIDDATRLALDALTGWAPLHMPGDLASIDAARAAWPEARHVACFDTAFHHTLPDEGRRLPLPADLDAAGIRRYGFHGLSMQSVIDAVPDLGGAVVAHLGGGCSVTALHDGRSMFTTMSLTPTGGIASATRSGDVDPEIPLLLLERPGATVDGVRALVGRQSGLAGIAGGVSDVRDLLAARTTVPAADLALRVFTRAVAGAIGAAVTTLPCWDTLVFTGGVGEHAPPVTGDICRRVLALRGSVELADPVGQARPGPDTGWKGDGQLWMDALRATGLRVLVVPADEAGVMVRQTRRLLADQAG